MNGKIRITISDVGIIVLGILTVLFLTYNYISADILKKELAVSRAHMEQIETRLEECNTGIEDALEKALDRAMEQGWLVN